MAYLLLNRTSHSESLRHGFSTRIHSQTRWRVNNHTQLCTRAVKKPERWEGNGGARSGRRESGSEAACGRVGRKKIRGLRQRRAPILHFARTRRHRDHTESAERSCGCHGNTSTRAGASACRDSIRLECGENTRNFPTTVRGALGPG